MPAGAGAPGLRGLVAVAGLASMILLPSISTAGEPGWLMMTSVWARAAVSGSTPPKLKTKTTPKVVKEQMRFDDMGLVS